MISILTLFISFITFGIVELADIEYTYIDEYAPISELNDLSLYEVFNENKLSLDFINQATLIEQDWVNTGQYGRIGTTDIHNGNEYYFRTNFTLKRIDVVSTIYYNFGTNQTLYSPLDTNNHIVSKVVTSTTDDHAVIFYTPLNSGLTGYPYDIAYLYDDTFVIDLTELGISQTAIQLDDYYDDYLTALTTNQHEYTYTINEITLSDIVLICSFTGLWVIGGKVLIGGLTI